MDSKVLKKRHSNLAQLCIWNMPGDDVVGLAARSRKVVGTLEQLLGGHPLYHYHSKVAGARDKLPRPADDEGGEDWRGAPLAPGLWLLVTPQSPSSPLGLLRYQNGNPAPDMGSVFMPVDRCTRANSCLQVLAGSHRLGRVDHFLMGSQSGADPARVEMARRLGCHHVHVEMEPGDALFFHCNLLHMSDQNSSDMRRWVLIASYNQVTPPRPAPPHPPRPGTAPRPPTTAPSTPPWPSWRMVLCGGATGEGVMLW